MIRILTDRRQLEDFLRGDPRLHLYELGDLDDFFWPLTTWYGSFAEEELEAVSVLYAGQAPPTLIALGERSAPVRTLLEGVREKLPETFYAHLSPGTAAALRPTHDLVPHGLHLKMVLVDPSALEEPRTAEVEPLGPADADDLQALYAEGHPDNWFDSRTLQTGCYLGIRTDGRLVCAGGVHVWSPRMRVAALGNIVTHPDWRGHGLGAALTSALCRLLRRDASLIGLNVSADNLPAIRCYLKLGFRVVAEYEEHMATRRRQGG